MNSNEGSGIENKIGVLNNENPLSVEQKKELIKSAGAETVSNITVAQRDAFHKYTGTAYANINATLRGIEKSFDFGNKENAQNLHSVLKSASLPCESTVYRGVSSKALGTLRRLPDDKLQGKVFFDKGFLSTSLDASSAFDGDLILEIHAPIGAHGLYVGYVSSAGHYEEEVLFDVNQNMRIDSVSRDELGRRLLKVTII